MNLSIGRNGEEIGEWTEEDVHTLYAQGQLLPTDYYWKEGMSEWKELGTLIKPPPPSVKLSSTLTVDQTQLKVASQTEITESEENRLIELGVESVKTVCHSFTTPLTVMENDLTTSKDPYVVIRDNLGRYFVMFFENAEYVETAGADHISKVIINETTRTDIKNKTYNSLSNELKNDAFQRFMQARQQLQGVMDGLNIKYQSICAAQGALVGGGLGYIATGRSSGVRVAAVAGALLGTVEQGRRKSQGLIQLQKNGMMACTMLLDALPSLADSLFDQFIIYTLGRRPSNNPIFLSALKKVNEEIGNEIIPRAHTVFSIIKTEQVAHDKVIARNVLIFIVVFIVLFLDLCFCLTR